MDIQSGGNDKRKGLNSNLEVFKYLKQMKVLLSKAS